MRHLWVRAEQRPNEERVGLMPEGAATLLAAGFRVTVEESSRRAIPIAGYAKAGCEIAREGSWADAPQDAIILGLKELPAGRTALRHRHIMFGHAFKGQPAGRVLLERLRAGGGTLLDLEYLVDDAGRRVAAFGYWAGYAGAAVALHCWAAQVAGEVAAPLRPYRSRESLLADLRRSLDASGRPPPDALIIGALGRVGAGAVDLCKAAGVPMTLWDMAETAHGGPFPEVLEHRILLNCILAGPGCPVFVHRSAASAPRRLRVIGDIACDPESDFSPIKIYDRVTDWDHPARRVHDAPPLDVTAIDNLPSLLPLEASQDFAMQLLPHLLALKNPQEGVWARAETAFREALDTP